MKESTITAFPKTNDEKICNWKKSSENKAIDSWAVKPNYNISTVINPFTFFTNYMVCVCFANFI